MNLRLLLDGNCILVSLWHVVVNPEIRQKIQDYANQAELPETRSAKGRGYRTYKAVLAGVGTIKLLPGLGSDLSTTGVYLIHTEHDGHFDN